MAAASVALATGTVQPRRAPNVAVEANNEFHLTYTPATSYATGGDAIDIVAALPFQVRKIVRVRLVPNALTLGYAGAYDSTNKKVLLWNGTTQATSTTDLSAAKFDMWVMTL